MEAVLTPARKDRTKAPQDGERTCLVSGELLPKDDLIRFVVGPNHSVVPDLAQKLPGRGLWVKAERVSIDTAARKNLFAKAAKEKTIVSPDLADQVALLMQRRCLDHLSMTCRAGIAILGEEQVQSALRGKRLGLLVLADDAGRALDNAAAIPECRMFTRAQLGAAFGYEQIVYVGIKPHALTDTLKQELKQLSRVAAIPVARTDTTTHTTTHEGC